MPSCRSRCIFTITSVMQAFSILNYRHIPVVFCLHHFHNNLFSVWYSRFLSIWALWCSTATRFLFCKLNHYVILFNAHSFSHLTYTKAVLVSHHCAMKVLQHPGVPSAVARSPQLVRPYPEHYVIKFMGGWKVLHSVS